MGLFNDNDEPSMYAVFIADGPFASLLKRQEARRASVPSPDKQMTSQIIEGFDNVEVYNLIVKLLGIQDFAAPTNGTKGFWDRYLGDL